MVSCCLSIVKTGVDTCPMLTQAEQECPGRFGPLPPRERRPLRTKGLVGSTELMVRTCEGLAKTSEHGPVTLQSVCCSSAQCADWLGRFVDSYRQENDILQQTAPN